MFTFNAIKFPITISTDSYFCSIFSFLSIISNGFNIENFSIYFPVSVFNFYSWCYSIFSVISFFTLRFLVCFYIIYIPKTIFYFYFGSNSILSDGFFIRFFIINNPKTIFADGNGRSIKNCFLVCFFPIDSPISIFDINFWSNSIFTINTFKICYGLSPISVVFWSIKVK